MLEHFVHAYPPILVSIEHFREHVTGQRAQVRVSLPRLCALSKVFFLLGEVSPEHHRQNYTKRIDVTAGILLSYYPLVKLWRLIVVVSHVEVAQLQLVQLFY